MAVVRKSLAWFAKECFEDAKQHRLTILAGAGVSMSAPSKLPSALQLKHEAIGALCDFPGLRRYAAKLEAAPRFKTLVLELFFQRLYEILGERLFSVFDGFERCRPNRGHALLAMLSGRYGTPLLTTNFDNLIEACQSKPRAVIHLHGELTNRSGMVVRINQVGQGLARSLTRRAGECICHRSLCVLGYSGTDEDVRLLLRQWRPRRILWLLRSPTDFAAANIERYFSQHNVTTAVGDLRSLIRLVAQKTGATAAPPPPVLPRALVPLSRTWRATLTFRERLMALAEVAFAMEDYFASVALAEYARKHAPATGRAWFEIHAANCYRVLGKSSIGLARARAALMKVRGSRDAWDSAGALNVLGLLYLERRRTSPKLALPCFDRAGRVMARALKASQPRDRREHMQLFAARIFNNLGLAAMQLGRMRRAALAFQRSIRLKRSAGDLIGIAATAANLAILYQKSGNPAVARRWRRRALHLIERYDRQFTKAYLLRRLGGLYCQAGRTTKGLEELNRALQIYRDLLGDGIGMRLTKRLIDQFSP